MCIIWINFIIHSTILNSFILTHAIKKCIKIIMILISTSYAHG